MSCADMRCMSDVCAVCAYSLGCVCVCVCVCVCLHVCILHMLGVVCNSLSSPLSLSAHSWVYIIKAIFIIQIAMYLMYIIGSFLSEEMERDFKYKDK